MPCGCRSACRAPAHRPSTAQRRNVVLVPLDEGTVRHRRIADRHDLHQRAAGQHETADMLRQMARKTHRTLEGWSYLYKREGFDALAPEPRSDAGTCRALDAEIRELVVAMKREDPGRSAPLILEELENAGRLKRGDVSVATIQRLLKRSGLSGPKLELDRPERLRWQASECGELWQADCCHGPKLFDPRAGREVRAKIFGLIDDRSRLVPYARADFHESQTEFLAVLLGAVKRRGVPRILLVDNHGSFTGPDTQVACAKLGIRLSFTRPHDGPAKGKIERWWRHLRGRVLDRLDMEKVKTLDDLNLTFKRSRCSYASFS